jgi:hypothetical protein
MQNVVITISSTFLPFFQRWMSWEAVLPEWWRLAEVEGADNRKNLADNTLRHVSLQHILSHYG